MKYEIKNAENTTLKTSIVIIFYIFALLISMFIFNNSKHEDIIISNKILNYLCYPIFKEYSLNESLLYIFNNASFVLFFSFFYIYEHVSAHNNIATRYNTKKWIIYKYLVGIITIIIISLIQYGCIACIFRDLMPNSLKYYIYPIVYKILIMTYVYTLYNCFKTNKILFILISLLALVSLLYFNPIMYFCIIILTFVFNYLFFSLKQFKYKIPLFRKKTTKK